MAFEWDKNVASVHNVINSCNNVSRSNLFLISHNIISLLLQAKNKLWVHPITTHRKLMQPIAADGAFQTNWSWWRGLCPMCEWTIEQTKPLLSAAMTRLSSTGNWPGEVTVYRPVSRNPSKLRLDITFTEQIRTQRSSITCSPPASVVSI